MKTKLLRQLRIIGENQILILSITRTNGIITGMKYRYNDDSYRGLFYFGDTIEDVKRRAYEIYLRNNIVRIRSKYYKYSRIYRNNPKTKKL